MGPLSTCLFSSLPLYFSIWNRWYIMSKTLKMLTSYINYTRIQYKKQSHDYKLVLDTLFTRPCCVKCFVVYSFSVRWHGQLSAHCRNGFPWAFISLSGALSLAWKGWLRSKTHMLECTRIIEPTTTTPQFECSAPQASYQIQRVRYLDPDFHRQPGYSCQCVIWENITCLVCA